MNDKPVLVYGATGMQGAAVARQLLQAGQPVRVVVRDPLKAEHWRQAGAEVVKGDYDDRASLEAAQAGIDRVILHLPLQYDLDSYELRADFKASWITHKDSAALSIAALNQPELAGSAFDIGGPEAVAGNDLAERFGRVLGKSVQYFAISPDDFEKALAPILGPSGALELADQFRWSATQPDATVDMAETARRLSVQLTTLDEWIKQHDWSIPA